MLAQLAEDIEKRGIKLGEERGEKRGEMQKAREAARKMKARGYPVEDIVDITGLSTEEVEKL
jgi:predicted transposase/invertase (TIGR01784 family)